MANFSTRIKLPKLGECAQKSSQTKLFLESFASWTHPVRQWGVVKAKKAELYDASFQWITRVYNGWGDAQSVQWVDALQQNLNKQWWERANGDIALPVFNEGYAPRSNESSRLIRPQYEPKVVAKGENPNHRRKLNATRATNALKHELKEMHWDREEDLYAHLMPVHGGFWLKSWWDQPWNVTNRLPHEGGVKCSSPGCDFKLRDPILDKGEYKVARGKYPPLAVGSDPASTARIHTCPQCEDHPALIPWDDMTTQVAQGVDSIGRPNGVLNPMGRPRMKVLSLYDVFVRNHGIDINPTKIPEWVETTIMSIPEAKLYWPQEAMNLEPSDSTALMNWHSVMGNPQFKREATFEDSVRLYCYYREPEIVVEEGIEPYMDGGRYVVMADSKEPVILADGPLMLDSATDKPGKVARAEIEWITWEIVAGGRMGCSGTSLWDLIFDAQDNRNEVASATATTRQRMAVPKYVVRAGMNVQALEISELGDFIQIDTDPLAPNAVPEVINNMTLNPTTQVEVDDAKDFIPRVTGYSDVEGGQVPGGVTAATALNTLTRESAERRKPRLKRISQALTRRWGHLLRLMQNLYAEPRAFYFEDVDGENVEESLTGIDIDDLMTVEVKEVSAFDSDDQRREIISGAIKDGILMPTESAELRRKLAKEMDVPGIFYEDENIQESSAQREWFYFRRYNKVPVVDPDMDDAKIHLDCHGKDCSSEEFREWEDQANWDGALAIIGPTWDVDLKMLQEQVKMSAQAVMMYPTMVQLAGSMVPPQPPPPPPPSMPSVQIQIVELWNDKLIMAGFTPPDPKALNYVLSWRAHMKAHIMEGENRMAIAQMGVPQMSSPGAPATAAGTTPTPDAPPADLATAMGGTMGGASAIAGSEGGDPNGG